MVLPRVAQLKFDEWWFFRRRTKERTLFVVRWRRFFCGKRGKKLPSYCSTKVNLCFLMAYLVHICIDSRLLLTFFHIIIFHCQPPTDFLSGLKALEVIGIETFNRSYTKLFSIPWITPGFSFRQSDERSVGLAGKKKGVINAKQAPGELTMTHAGRSRNNRRWIDFREIRCRQSHKRGRETDLILWTPVFDKKYLYSHKKYRRKWN